ncbi:MAG: NAD(P)H-binding protein [Planctomycetota bacterium]
MKLLVLGASGRIGRWLIRLAVERGHDVDALVRPGSVDKVPAGARIILGDPTDPETLGPIVFDHNTVLSAVGQRRAGLHPWARLLSPPDLVEQVLGAIHSAATNANQLRLIWMSAGGAGGTQPMLSPSVRRLTRTGNVGVAYRDLERAEALDLGGRVEATAVRPVTLLPGDSGRSAVGVSRYKLTSVVRRGDVARWMIDAAESNGNDQPAMIG